MKIWVGAFKPLPFRQQPRRRVVPFRREHQPMRLESHPRLARRASDVETTAGQQRF